jgi:hypothetical protein
VLYCSPFLRDSVGRRQGRSACSTRLAHTFGNSIQKQLPWPGVDSRPNSLCIRATAFWTMASPMPVPGYCDCECSRRKFQRCGFGIPAGCRCHCPSRKHADGFLYPRQHSHARTNARGNKFDQRYPASLQSPAAKRRRFILAVASGGNPCPTWVQQFLRKRWQISVGLIPHGKHKPISVKRTNVSIGSNSLRAI